MSAVSTRFAKTVSDDRIRVLVRLSRPQSDGTWETHEAEHDTPRPSGVTVEDAIVLELEVLEKAVKNNLPVSQPKPSSPGKPSQAAISISDAELAKLEWKPYREGHSAAWIFTDKAPRTLVDQLEKGPVTIGQFTYKFSGPEEKPKLFVSRAPVKE